MGVGNPYMLPVSLNVVQQLIFVFLVPDELKWFGEHRIHAEWVFEYAEDYLVSTSEILHFNFNLN